MRTIVLTLMIALLPMRMWAADGMAIGMAHGQLAAAELSTMSSMPEDCPLMAEARQEHESQDSSSAGAHCMSCHLCAAAACLAEAAFGPGPVPTGPPHSDSSRYVSAALAPDLRPPIP